MALTKDKLVVRLQTQIGLTKPESTQDAWNDIFEIMKSTLADGEDLLISGFRKFQVREKKKPAGAKILKRKKILMLRASKGGGV